jgi:hypothetical protein
MLVLFCVQVVQTNNNEFSWKEKKKTTTLYCRPAKDMQACQENKIKFNKKKSGWQCTQGAQTKCKLSH